MNKNEDNYGRYELTLNSLDVKCQTRSSLVKEKLNWRARWDL